LEVAEVEVAAEVEVVAAEVEVEAEVADSRRPILA
jgi:hypothetical protein